MNNSCDRPPLVNANVVGGGGGGYFLEKQDAVGKLLTQSKLQSHPALKAQSENICTM